MAKRDVDEELIRRLASLLDEIGLTEIEYSERGWSVRVSKAAKGAIAAPPRGGGGANAPTPAGRVSPPLRGALRTAVAPHRGAGASEASVIRGGPPGRRGARPSPGARIIQ